MQALLLQLLSLAATKNGLEISPSANDPGFAGLVDLINRHPGIAGLEQYYQRIEIAKSDDTEKLKNAENTKACRRRALVEWVRRLPNSNPRKDVFVGFVELASRCLDRSSATALLELLDHPDAKQYWQGSVDIEKRLAEARSKANNVLASAPSSPVDTNLGPRVFVLFTRMEKGTPTGTETRAIAICEHIGRALARERCRINIGGKRDDLTVKCCEAYKDKIGVGSIEQWVTTYVPSVPDYDERGRRWKSYHLGKILEISGKSSFRRPVILGDSDVCLICAGIVGHRDYVESLIPQMRPPLPVVPIPHAGGYSKRHFEKLIQDAARNCDQDRLRRLRAIAAEPSTACEIAESVIDLVLYEHRARKRILATTESKEPRGCKAHTSGRSSDTGA